LRSHHIAVIAIASCTARAGAQELSATTRAQIREVAASARSLGSPAAAHAAGFEPVFGWIPTMGVHYVNEARMKDGRTFKLVEPSQLMFSPIAGKDSLVGAAYAYLAPVGDSARPVTFQDNPPWHEHPNLAPPGQTLVMLHVWFVPSPDGPFAGHNFNLPFWALGLAPPNAERLVDSVAGPMIRKAALALSEVADTAGLFPVLAAREPLHTQLRELRDSVRVLVPALERSQFAGDWGQWERTAARAARHWDSFRAAYLSAVVLPERRARMAGRMDEMTSSPNGAVHGHPRD